MRGIGGRGGHLHIRAPLWTQRMACASGNPLLAKRVAQRTPEERRRSAVRGVLTKTDTGRADALLRRF